jgi:hypothetical protein
MSALSGDASVAVVASAIGFVTAAHEGEATTAIGLAAEALDLDAIGFLDALVSTVQAVTDDAEAAGTDVRACLREVGLGVQLAALAEHLDADGPTDTRERPDQEH